MIMKQIISASAFFTFFILIAGCGMAQKSNKYPDPQTANSKTVFPVQHTEVEWKKLLTADQYYIRRHDAARF
jgi:hypothetical protein